MNEKQSEDSRKSFMREKIPSMKRRSIHNDYYGRHIYMLTLAVEGRKAILGKLVGNIRDEDDPPHIELSPLGKAVQACWESIPLFHPEARCLGFQIMPDHLHGILFVEHATDKHLGQIVSGFKAGCNKAYRLLYSEAVPLSTDKQAVPLSTDKQAVPMNTDKQAVPMSTDKQAVPMSTNKQAVPMSTDKQAVPMNTDKQAAPMNTVKQAVPMSTNKQAVPLSTNKQAPYSDLPLPSVMRLKKDDRSKGLLFERGYNDLISKNYDMLPRIINYVNDNPRRLAIKRAYPDYFKVRFGISIGQQTYAAIGNRFLLDHPDKLQVQCSRKLTDEEIRTITEQHISKARNGAILVSPAISKGEQTVMRTALNEGLPIIFLTPWGFTTFSKPGHQYYDACAEGRLLILAPWEHQTERTPLTRAMCLQLNAMVEDICKI